MLKSLLTYGLSLFIILANFHLDSHDHDNYDGYNICKIDCENVKHFKKSHQCEQCTSKKNRLIVQKDNFLSFSEFEILYYAHCESFDDPSTSFSLYSRPPPNIL